MLRQDGQTPLYLQIKNLIQRQIEEGMYADGDKLPSESQMCQAYSVSRIPVRKALGMLEAEGLIQSFQGKGSFVKTPKIRNDLVHISTFAETLAHQGYCGHTKIVSFCENNTDPAVQVLLDAGKEGFSRLQLLGYANEDPVVFYDSCLVNPLAYRFYDAAKAAQECGEAFSTFDLYGKTLVTIGKMEQKIVAVNADHTVSKMLNIPQGTAVLVLETVILNSRMEAVEYKRGYYRTDKYSFNLNRSL